MSDREQGRLADLLAGDWLVPIDDALTYRHARCTLCERLVGGFFDIATLDDGRCISYRLCIECERRDPKREKVGRLLQQRYGPQ